MQDNSGLRAGDITNGAHSRNASSSKKESSSSKSSGGFSEMFRQAFAALKDAEAAAKTDEKKQAAADKLVDKFVQNFREADGDTQLKIAESLKKQNLQDIMRPEIFRPEIFRPKFYSALEGNRSGETMTLGDAFSKAFGGAGGAARSVSDALKEQQSSQSNNGDTNGDGKNAWAELVHNAMQEVKDEEDEKDTPIIDSPDTKAEEVYEYTYKPGDTFGQVLMKIGLSDGRNLWGPNGDVEYYRKQLRDQGLYGNIPIGRTIRLRRRK